jgi:hypothetical protein
MYVIGIDVQGDSKGIGIKGNRVDLEPGDLNNVLDAYIALVIGENADDAGAGSTIIVENNVFAQEYQIQNTNGNRRHIRMNRRIMEQFGKTTSSKPSVDQ